MPKHRVFAIVFAKVYPLYVEKRNARTVRRKKLTKSSAG